MNPAQRSQSQADSANERKPGSNVAQRSVAAPGERQVQRGKKRERYVWWIRVELVTVKEHSEEHQVYKIIHMET